MIGILQPGCVSGDVFTRSSTDNGPNMTAASGIARLHTEHGSYPLRGFDLRDASQVGGERHRIPTAITCCKVGPAAAAQVYPERAEVMVGSGRVAREVFVPLGPPVRQPAIQQRRQDRAGGAVNPHKVNRTSGGFRETIELDHRSMLLEGGYGISL